LTPEVVSPPAPPRVTVIIVSRNRKESLRELLESLGTSSQVIVVDNASTDGTPSLTTEFPSARFIPLPKNFGLTKALNVGLRGAEGQFLLFLHDDVLLSGEAVEQLANVLDESPEVGAVAPLFEGSPQASSLPSPSHPYPQWHTVEGTANQDVECLSGAALMVRHQFIRAMRQIDERYGNYGSDIDLSAQVVRRAGKKIRIACNVKALHRVSGKDTSLTEADRVIGTAVFLGKYYGFFAGLKFQVLETLKSVFLFRLGLAKHLLANQKLDGTQPG
jgi:N-acetylglucosaminyl-diphospho-decaprenol L-rhamnosyltransferase